MKNALGVRLAAGGALAALAVCTIATWETPPAAPGDLIEPIGEEAAAPLAPDVLVPADSGSSGRSFDNNGTGVSGGSTMAPPLAVPAGARDELAAAVRDVITTSEGPTASGDELALVGPLLEMLAVGSGVGPGLMCSLLTGLVAQGIPDPAVASAAAQIVEICGDGGNQQAAALRSVAEQLSSLAALNPLANALIRQSAVFVRDLDPALPFEDLADQLAGLLDFFATDTPAG